MTPEERAEITLEQFDAAMYEIAARLPFSINPLNEAGNDCVYTAHDNPDRHCLVGQFLAENDPDVLDPAIEGKDAKFLLIMAGYSYDVAHRAGEWQATADSAIGEHNGRRNWAGAARFMRTQDAATDD